MGPWGNTTSSYCHHSINTKLLTKGKRAGRRDCWLYLVFHIITLATLLEHKRTKKRKTSLIWCDGTQASITWSSANTEKQRWHQKKARGEQLSHSSDTRRVSLPGLQQEGWHGEWDGQTPSSARWLLLLIQTSVLRNNYPPLYIDQHCNAISTLIPAMITCACWQSHA